MPFLTVLLCANIELLVRIYVVEFGVLHWGREH